MLPLSFLSVMDLSSDRRRQQSEAGWPPPAGAPRHPFGWTPCQARHQLCVNPSVLASGAHICVSRAYKDLLAGIS